MRACRPGRGRRVRRKDRRKTLLLVKTRCLAGSSRLAPLTRMMGEINMADATVGRCDYYVYVLFREDGRPFYVGKGKRDRWLVHEREAHRRDDHRSRLIRDIKSRGHEIPKIKVREGLSNDDAIAVEIALIAAIGREPLGPLINQTMGGDGVRDLPAATRAEQGRKVSLALRGRRHTPETIARMRAAHLGKVISDQQRRLARGAAEKRRQTPEALKRTQRKRDEEEAKIRLRQGGKRLPLTKETRLKISQAHIGKKLSEKTRALISINNAASSETVRKKLRVSSAARWANPDERERYREIGRQAARARWDRVRSHQNACKETG